MTQEYIDDNSKYIPTKNSLDHGYMFGGFDSSINETTHKKLDPLKENKEEKI